jgi:hypothetical protein
VKVMLFRYPGGWSPLAIDPTEATEATALTPNPDGSQTATITVTKTGAFAASTYSLVDLAVSQTWELQFIVRQYPEGDHLPL